MNKNIKSYLSVTIFFWCGVVVVGIVVVEVVVGRVVHVVVIGVVVGNIVRVAGIEVVVAVFLLELLLLLLLLLFLDSWTTNEGVYFNIALFTSHWEIIRIKVNVLKHNYQYLNIVLFILCFALISIILGLIIDQPYLLTSNENQDKGNNIKWYYYFIYLYYVLIQSLISNFTCKILILTWRLLLSQEQR